LADFFLSPADLVELIDEEEIENSEPNNVSGESITNSLTPSTEIHDLNGVLNTPNNTDINEEVLMAIEKEFSGMTSEELERVYDQFHTDDFFHRIVSHTLQNGTLIFTVRYTTDGDLGEHLLEIPYSLF
jgi:hypothetical protein